ncbi:Ankyrin repeat [Nitrosospira sp. Nl5]|uniref:ankyrin repeat domain-containing protein n=1 Tax=Nitrosospira sp. Nl5 TaxID=200120 RepID=UPI00088EC66A|nr:ankyrin repeat domain-containing protein [Nitrosospira sp. Nl5]SCX83506.1 Ankyrin repeat [Nitrosospira sp. Nl5]
MEDEEKKNNIIFTAESIVNSNYRNLFREIGDCGLRSKWVKKDGKKVPVLAHPLYPPPYLRLDFIHLFDFLKVRTGTGLQKLHLEIDNSSIEWAAFSRGRNRNVSNKVVTTGICTASRFLKIPLISLLAQFLEDCETKKIRLSSYAKYEKVIERFLQDALDLVEQSQAISPPPFSQDNQEPPEQPVTKNSTGYKPVTGKDKWLDPNNYTELPLRGRGDEFNFLNEFIEADGPFKIWAVAGPSGAGKTRLVSEWSTTSPKLTGWRCRVLHKEDRAEPDPGKWVRGSSADSILIIIDYMYGFEKVIQKLMKNRFEATSPKIRLLVIDHIFSEDLHKDERWGLTGTQSSFNQNEDYFFKLKPLDLRQTQKEIIKSIIARRANIDEGSNPVANANTYLLGLKEQGAYLPLFAALVGDAIRSSKDFTVWNRRELIDYYLSGNDRLPWEHGTKTGRWASHFIAVATARRNMAYGELYTAAKKFNSVPKNFGKVKKICQKVITRHDEIILAPFEPDILGESFFLKFLQFLQDSEYQEEFRQAFITGDANSQAKDAKEFIGFIQRLTRNLLNDDQNNKETRSLWNALFGFMTPSNFEDAQPMKWAVTAGLIDIVDEIKDRFPEDEIVALLTKVEPAILYHDTNDHSLRDSVIRAMLYFEISHKFTEKTPEFPDEMFALFERFKATNGNEGMPLMLASYHNLNNVIKVLIANKVNIEARLPNDINALMCASMMGHTETVKCLLNGQANIDVADEDGCTALIWATFSNHIETVRLLLEKGAKIDTAANNGRTALMVGCTNGHIEMVRLLLDEGATMDIADNNGWTALIGACTNGHIETVRLLLERGARKDIADKKGWTALIWALINFHFGTVRLLHDWEQI